MANNQVLTHTPSTVDVHDFYGYPITSKVDIITLPDSSGEIHNIWGVDVSPVTNHANAPNGSNYYPMVAVGGDSKIWHKFATTFGAHDGTWAATAALA